MPTTLNNASREELLKALRDTGHVVICWSPEDVRSIREGWSDERCTEELYALRTKLEDRLTERGWDILEGFLPMADDAYCAKCEDLFIGSGDSARSDEDPTICRYCHRTARKETPDA